MNWIVWIVIFLIVLFLVYYFWRDRQQKEAAARRAEEQARQSAARKAALGTAAGAGAAGVAAVGAALADAKDSAARTGAGLADDAATFGRDTASSLRDAADDTYDAGLDTGSSVRSAVDDAGDALDDLKRRAASLLDDGADLGRDAAHDAHDAARDAGDAAHSAARDARDVVHGAARDTRDAVQDAAGDARDAAHGIRHTAKDAGRDASRAGDDLIGGAAGVWSEAARPVDATADELRERAADLGASGDSGGASRILDDLEQRAKHTRADAADAVDDLGQRVGQAHADARDAADDLLAAHRAGDDLPSVRTAASSAIEPVAEVEERQQILAEAADALAATEAQRHLTDIGGAIAGFTPHVGDVPRGAVAGTGAHACPDAYPVKGNEPSMIYHQPGDNWYERTIPELCFATAAAAEAAGFRAARHGGGHAADSTAGAAAEPVVAPAEPVVGPAYTGEVPAGALAGDGRRSCPAGHPVKGNASSMIFHQPGDPLYERTIPELCFASAGDAEAAGFRAARHGGGGHGNAAGAAEPVGLVADAASAAAAAAPVHAEWFVASEPYTGEVPNGAVAGDGTRACPSGFAVKGNVPSMIYHLPGQPLYGRTIPELCFRSARDAAKAGFRPVRSRSAAEPVLAVESEAMADDAPKSFFGRVNSRLDEIALALSGVDEGAETAGGSARGLTGQSLLGLLDEESDVLKESPGVRRCPASHPIKGNLDSNLYHVPGGASYNQTIAEFCFATREAAETAGFDASKR